MILEQKKLITIQVIYYRPDYRHLLQVFIWQTDDFVPQLPRTHKFLLHWKDHIDAVIRDVLIAEADREFRPAAFYGILNDSQSIN